jgi:hypothetical protein
MEVIVNFLSALIMAANERWEWKKSTAANKKAPVIPGLFIQYFID